MGSRRTFAIGSLKAGFFCARLAFAVFVVLTSAYCLLAYIPFTYHWLIQSTLVKWLPVFVKLHTLLYWILLSLVVATLAPDLGRSRRRRLAIGFIAIQVTAGVFFIFHPLLSNLPNDDRSYYLSLISLFPLFWLAAIDYSGHVPERKWLPGEDQHLTVRTVLLAAGFLSAVNMGVCYLRFISTGEVHLRGSERLVILSWSLASHTLVFLLTFVAIGLIRTLSSRFANAPMAEFYLCNLMICLLLVLLFRQTVLPTLTFNGRAADVFSIVAASSIVAFISGLGLRLQANGESLVGGGFRLALAPLLFLYPRKTSPRLVRFGWLGLIAILAYLIPVSTATRDWDFLFQKLGVVLIWTVTFVLFFALQSRILTKSYRPAGIFLITIISAGSYAILRSSEPLLPALLNDEQLDVNATLDRYAGYDVSFKLAREILRPNLNLFPSTSANQIEGDRADSRDLSFYGFLRENTNLLPSVKAGPVDFTLTGGDLSHTDGEKPNIFMFVIDSLRPDYLSPYNKSVNFTPNIESFAGESIVMRNAFTRYGGTVLSEPSIWTGTLQLHKQYIDPYYPMNSLQKLIETEGYESFMTIDPVVRIVTKPSPDITELDKDHLWFEYDFCQTLKELQTTIDQRSTPTQPMFVYTQPQNVHRVVLKDKGDPVPPGESFPGFFPSYASQVKYMDNCFGEFVQYLKARGLYDNSIVILTSDHGDSLGEEGRWGHSYWMFPEILRVPMIIHLPARMRKGLTFAPKSPAFTTDITPTLYYLLGHRPIDKNVIYGRPLLTSTEKEQVDYLQKSYLVVSSYGPVYGILSGDARSLFIADAVNQKDYFFDLLNDPKATRNQLTPAIQAENEKSIRELVVSVNKFYNLGELP